LKDWGLAEATTGKAEGTIVKTIGLNNQGKAGLEHPSEQLHETTLIKTIVSGKEELSQNIKKQEYTTDSLAL
jgi:hypothetical protein